MEHIEVIPHISMAMTQEPIKIGGTDSIYKV